MMTLAISGRIECSPYILLRAADSERVGGSTVFVSYRVQAEDYVTSAVL
jgi:hypothetical protein